MTDITLILSENPDPAYSSEEGLILFLPLDDGYEEHVRDLASNNDGYLVAGFRDMVIDEDNTVQAVPWFPNWRYDMVSPIGRIYSEMNLTLRPELEGKTYDQGLVIPHPAGGVLSAFTIFFWFRLQETPLIFSTRSLAGTILVRGSNSSDYSIRIWIASGGGSASINAQIIDSDGSSDTVTHNIDDSLANIYWHSLCLRFDPILGLQLRIDKVIDSNGFVGAPNTSVLRSGTDNKFTLGNNYNFGDDFSGCFSGFRVYNKWIQDGLVQFLEAQVEHRPYDAQTAALHHISHHLGVYEYQSDIYFQGRTLDDNPLPEEHYGAMYELNANYADTFGNFISMVPVEPNDPILFRQFGSRRNAYLNGTDQRIDTDPASSGFDFPGLVGAAGNGDWTLGAQFWVDSEDFNSLAQPTYLLFMGYDSTGGGGAPDVYISLTLWSGGSVTLNIKNGPLGYTHDITLPNLSPNSWYRFAMSIDFDNPVGSAPVQDPALGDASQYYYFVHEGSRIWVDGKLIGLITSEEIVLDSEGNPITIVNVTYDPPFPTHTAFLNYEEPGESDIATLAPISLGAGLDWYNGSGDYLYGSPISARRLFLANKIMANSDLIRLGRHPRPFLYLKTRNARVDYSDFIQWVYDDRIRCQIPRLSPGNYSAEIENRSFGTTIELPFSVQTIEHPGVQDEAITYTFDDPKKVVEQWEALHRQWGGIEAVENGGVIRKNVSLENGKLVLAGHGDSYDGSVQGATKFGSPSAHKTRAGSAVGSHKYFGPGRFDIWAQFGNKIGTAYALWLFHYEEIYPEDDRWQDFLDEGLARQGTAFKGYYIVRNHEIDFPENPSTLKSYTDPTEARISFQKFNSWRGELAGEYNDNFFQIPWWINDGLEHKFTCDWWMAQNNIIFAGDAESDTTGPWWTMTQGQLDRYPYDDSPWPLSRPQKNGEEYRGAGMSFFVGASQQQDISGYQECDISAHANDIDTGDLWYTFEVFTGGLWDIDSYASFTVEFLNSAGSVIQTVNWDGYHPSDRNNITSMLRRYTRALLPITTRKIRVIFTMHYDTSFNYPHNTGFWDELELRLWKLVGSDPSFDDSFEPYNILNRRRTRYLIDDMPVRSIYGNKYVPYIPMKLTLGQWFPSSGDFHWAGRNAAWHTQKMRISQVDYTPYDQTGRVDQEESYPRTGYAQIDVENIIADGPVPDQLTTMSFEINANDFGYWTENPSDPGYSIIYDNVGGWQLEHVQGDNYANISTDPSNGQYFVRWSEAVTNQYAYSSDYFVFPKLPKEIAVVAAFRVTANPGLDVRILGDPTVNDEALIGRDQSGRWVVGYSNAKVALFPAASADDGAIHILRYVSDGTNATLWIDGVNQGTNTLLSPQTADLNRWTVGGQAAGIDIFYLAALNNSAGLAEAESATLETWVISEYLP